MLSSRLFRSLLTATAAVAVAVLFAASVAGAQTWRPWPQTPLSGSQLSASSTAADKHGVPVNIERGVTTYKYGPGASTANFDLVATQLAYWYKALYPRYGGSALVNWTRAAAAEMGQGVSPSDVARATANQQTAINTILTGPFWVLVAGFLPGAEAIGAAAPGEVGIGGTAAAPAAPAGGAAAAGGSAATKATNALSTSDPQEGTPQRALSTVPMAALAAVATVFIVDHVSSGTQVNLVGGWFQSLYSAVENYAWMFALLALACGGIYVMVAGAVGKDTGLLAMLADVPYAALLMLAVPALVMAGVGLTDSLCSDLMKQFPQGTQLLHAMVGVLGALGGASLIAGHFGHAGLANALGNGAWWIALFGLLTSGAVALELIAREIAIYLTVLMLPLALIGEFFSPFRGWSADLLRVVFVVVAAKLLLAIGLVMAGSMAAAGLAHFSVVMMITAIIAVGLMTLLPAVVYGALLRVGTAWHSRVSSVVVGSSAMARQHSLARQVRNGSERVRGSQHHDSPPARRPQPSDHPHRRPSPSPSSSTREGTATASESESWRRATTSSTRREDP